jgi:hypothetical protein
MAGSRNIYRKCAISGFWEIFYGRIKKAPGIGLEPFTFKTILLTVRLVPRYRLYLFKCKPLGLQFRIQEMPPTVE